MAANESVSLTFEADLSALRKELASIPGMTEKEAKAAVRQLEINYKKAEKAASKAARASSAAAKSAGAAASKASKEAAEGLLELGDLAGFSKDRIDKLSKGLAAFSNPVTLGAAAVGGLAVALVAAGAAAVELVRYSKEASKAVEPFRELEGFNGVSPQALSALETANASLDALGTLAKQAALLFAADLAPAVELGATTAVKLGLAFVDTVNSFAKGQGVIREIGRLIGTFLVRANFSAVTAINELGRAFGTLAKGIGQDAIGDYFLEEAAKYDRWTASVGASLSDAALGGLGEVIGEVNASLSDYDARAAELIGLQVKVNRAAGAGSKAATEQAKALDAQAAAAKAAAAAYAQLQRANEAQAQVEAFALENARLAASLSDDSGLQIALIEAEADARRKAAEEQADQLRRLGRSKEAQILLEERYALISQQSAEQVAAIQASQEVASLGFVDRLGAQWESWGARTTTVIGEVAQAAAAFAALELQQTQQRLDQIRTARDQLGENITKAQAKRLRKAEKEEQKAAVKAFRAQQASALAIAAVQGAQAVIAALAQLGPVAGPIAAAAISAAVGAQAAVIAGASPPKFHRGGMIGSSDPRAGSDRSERMAVVRQGEAVLTPQGVAAIGGPAGVDAANGGRAGAGGPIVVNLQLRRQTLQSVLVDYDRAANRGTGRRNPYRGETRR